MKRSEGTEKVRNLQNDPFYKPCNEGILSKKGLFQCPQAKRLGVEAMHLLHPGLSQKPVIQRLTREPLKKQYLLSWDCG